MVFSTNQTRQLYVMNEYKATPAAEGNIAAKSNEKDKRFLYFQHYGKGGLTRSDLISVDNIISMKVTEASDMRVPLKKIKVTLNETPINGQDYILRINLRQYLGMSDEDQYQKYGIVRAYGTSAAPMGNIKFYALMASSLAKNFSREVVPVLKFKVGDKEITAKDKITDEFVNSLSGELIIEEVEQPHEVGLFSKERVYFETQCGTIESDGQEVVWGTVTDETEYNKANLNDTNSYGNGAIIADLEYFCLGERADQYRNIGWPNSIPSKTMVDSSLTYDVIDIHYAYVGSNEGSQKSEKDITIVCPYNASHTQLNALINAIKAAVDVTKFSDFKAIGE